MEIGESQTSKPILANKPWNGTGIQVKNGELYTIQVVPGDHIWHDVDITGLIVESCTAEGFSGSFVLNLFSWSKRMSKHQWLSLIGSVDKDKNSFFYIGKNHEGYRPSSSGELVCFGNDTKGFYKKNRGEMIIEVKRIG